MTPFELHTPTCLEEATALLSAGQADRRPMGGGTALMLMMKAGVLRPQGLVSLRGIGGGSRRIELQDNGELHIGAQVTMSQLEHSVEVRHAAPAIVRTMRRLSNVRIRNVATVGGNLAHGDPHMDLPPLLSALDAHVVASSQRGERRIAVDALITGYYETTLAKDELITKLIVPSQRQRSSAYIKVTTRSADDWPALGVAASLRVEAGAVQSCRLFMGAATDHPIRLTDAEQLLAGRKPDVALLARAGEAAAEAADFIGDAQGSAAYKKELLRVYLGRAVTAAMDNTADGGPR